MYAIAPPITVAPGSALDASSHAGDEAPGVSSPELDVLPTATEPLVYREPLVYQDGVLLEHGYPDFTRDIKVVRREPEVQRFTNYPGGYVVGLPPGMELDFKYSPAYVRALCAELDIKISRERSPYGDVEMYLRDYPNRFTAREDFSSHRQVNGIELIEDTWQVLNGHRARIIALRRTPAAGSEETQNEYLLAYVLASQREFYCLFFRTESLEAQRAVIEGVLGSFTPVEPQGSARFNLDLHPVPGNWNAETRAFYDQMVSGEGFYWGVFYPWALTDPEAYERVTVMERALGFEFPILLHYLHADHPFPTGGMQQAFERGQVVELTMQTVTFDSENAGLRSAHWALLDGEMDDVLREFARDAKAFGHPFLFRLNNEMNTDWTQYGGVRTLLDVDVYIKVWQRIYRIFKEEGVDNAIWVFNPNECSYPPMNWNHHSCYYPGNEYVHVIGLTGYNTGDYFKGVTGERWRSFSQIYEPLALQYRALYSQFPWIITEFASSSVGGDKERWIREMFAALPRFPEIRAAVWWSYADFDYRPGREDIAARRYWLDESESYLSAFRAGLAGQGLIE
ncbi:MAG: glycosyl hydrolase [Bacillota bacterium]